jgi:hypothetical protein
LTSDDRLELHRGGENATRGDPIRSRAPLVRRGDVGGAPRICLARLSASVAALVS